MTAELPPIEIAGQRWILTLSRRIKSAGSVDGQESVGANLSDLRLLLTLLDHSAFDQVVATVKKDTERRDRERCDYYLQPAGFPIPNPPRCTLKRHHDGDHSPSKVEGPR